MQTGDIQIRDPFIYVDQADKTYIMFGTTDEDCWYSPGVGFDCYQSSDLINWAGPIPAFRPAPDFWGEKNFWAPEVHSYNGRFYMFATFVAEQRYRGTQILVADVPTGPYAPLTDGPITPPDWQCLDGTLYVDDAGDPWIVFCHEWVQIHNGSICALQLSADLKVAVGRPAFLFSASEAPWVTRPDWPDPDAKFRFPRYVTDGPSMVRLADGTLVMLWSSFGSQGYAMGVSRSQTGLVTGPWTHDPAPLWAEDGGHGMIFRTLDGRPMLTFHSPNKTPDERAVFVEVEEVGGTLRLKT